MKIRLLLILSVCLPIMLNGQDMRALSELDINGTARYLGLSGAMTAVGGDPTAVSDNPAGLGIYRHSELMFTMDYLLNITAQNGMFRPSATQDFTVNQASWVYAIPSRRESGLLYNNIMLSYRRLKTFANSFYGRAKEQPTSLVDLIKYNTDDLDVSFLSQDDSWSDPNVGWLSILGYETWLISEDENDPSRYWSCLQKGEQVDNILSMSELGHINQYALHWAGNINNQWYVGLGVNILSLSYDRTISYSEDFEQGGGLHTSSTTLLSGVGVNGTVGLIYHPIRMLRIGASFQTPSVNYLSRQSIGSMASYLDKTYTIDTPTSFESWDTYSLPLRSSIGVALIGGNYGLLSLQYDYVHCLQYQEEQSPNSQDLHSLRIGGEATIFNFYFRAGFAYESSFLKESDEPIYDLPYSSTSIDPSFRHLKSAWYASVGVGYRGRYIIADLTYQAGGQEYNLYPYAMAEAYQMMRQTNRVVLSLAWHW